MSLVELRKKMAKDMESSDGNIINFSSKNYRWSIRMELGKDKVYGSIMNNCFNVNNYSEQTGFTIDGNYIRITGSVPKYLKDEILKKYQELSK
jgi:hypothetical protein